MNFNKLAEENNWECKKRILYGERYGLLLTMAQNDVNVSVFIPLIGINSEQKQQITEDLNARQKELQTTFAFDNAVLYFSLTKFVSDDDVKNTLNEVLEYLRNHLEYNKVCVYCGKNDADTASKIRGIQYYAHKECIPQQKQMEYGDPNYLKGTLGAILGGIIGTIPWVIVSVIGFYAGILGYLIGLSAFKGYRQLGGKLGPATRYIILLTVILSVFIGEFANLVIEFIKTDVPFTIDNIIFNIQHHDLGTEIIENTLLGLGMALLGVMGLFRRLKVR